MYTVVSRIRFVQVEYVLEVKIAKRILFSVHIYLSMCLEVADLGGYGHIG